MSSTQLVDDSNPAVQYVPGWIWETLVNEVDGTRHGAADTGLSATLAFVGTGIQVVGTLQRTSGHPVATFTIDGEGNTTYSAPAYSSTEDAIYNIINMNGTGTNVLWLDYFLVDPSPASVSSTSAGSSQSSTSLSSASAFSSSASPEATSSTSQSAKRGNTAAIVGGVVGGVALLILLGILLFCLRRRRRMQVAEKAIQPFKENATRSSIEESGYPSPSKWSDRPFSVDSPSTRLDIATLDIGPQSPRTASHITGSDGPIDEPSTLSSTEPPLEPVSSPLTPQIEAKASTPRSVSGQSPTSTVTSPAAPMSAAPVPTDIGQALSHASPELQSTAFTLIRSLLQRNQSHEGRPVEVDSGLRIVDEANMVPPPEYTAD
ncbi:hypothetical protein C8T65DRAFT_745502 [Cerioporus squamosus]|nr:hypothetical protein C8T65DRAFT_745502 [Cerioporus squamosus]